MEEQSINDKFDIVPTHLVVQAMRDNGYKNAAYAIAELMDNAIQAKASLVELLCAEKDEIIDQYRRKRINQIAVLDNGSGMDSNVLRMALQFGNGTRLTPDKHTGMGRFGMGLPSSSVSQCRRVEVWSWQNGVENAIYTYLDLDEISRERLSSVPTPIAKAVPELWKKTGKGWSKSGSLVVWSSIDRCMWKSAGAIISNSELLIGRMYRKFLERGEVKIRFSSFDVDNPYALQESFALPNDPGYLMENTSCPAPFNDKAMFDPWGDTNATVDYKVNFRGETYVVTITFSVAKEDARIGENAGNTPHGRHAGKNVGISIVRAGRELELNQSLVNIDARERWWGIEVDFPPALDDLFGVTNNKQFARNFSEISKYDFEALTRGGKTLHQVKQELEADGDPSAPLLEVMQCVQSRLSSLRKMIQNQRLGTRTAQRHGTTGIEKMATQVTVERQQEGHEGSSDKDESLPPEKRIEMIEQSLINDGLTEKTAEELAARTVSDSIKYMFVPNDLESAAFFSVKIKGGAIIITLNTSHPAYDHLMGILEKDPEGASEEELQTRLRKAHEGIKLLLAAWARYEDELPDGPQKTRAMDMRSDWGRMARQFLERAEE